MSRSPRIAHFLCNSCYGAEQENGLLEHYEQDDDKQKPTSGSTTKPSDVASSSTSVMEISKPTNFKRGVHIAIDQENGVLKGEFIILNMNIFIYLVG